MVKAASLVHYVVNPRSGGGLGAKLIAALQSRHGASAVHILGELDLEECIAAQTQLGGSGQRWVACGGDGTINAVAQALLTYDPQASLGVIPLGTGNDFARSTGWAGWETRDGWSAIDAALSTAKPVPFDVWQLSGPQIERLCLNYCSIGGDAAVALHFHEARNRHPQLLCKPWLNKGLYAYFGAAQRAVPLADLVTFSDDMRVPSWASAIVCSNIDSYAGGVQLAENSDFSDGLAEVVALGSGMTMGLVALRLRRPRLLGRVKMLSWTLHAELAMQIDGEPMMAKPGRYCLKSIQKFQALRPTQSLGAGAGVPRQPSE